MLNTSICNENPNYSQDDRYDNDSGIGTDLGSETWSIKSSLRNYKYENGRTYHSFRDGQYAVPNDAQEQVCV